MVDKLEHSREFREMCAELNGDLDWRGDHKLECTFETGREYTAGGDEVAEEGKIVYRDSISEEEFMISTPLDGTLSGYNPDGFAVEDGKPQVITPSATESGEDEAVSILRQ